MGKTIFTMMHLFTLKIFDYLNLYVFFRLRHLLRKIQKEEVSKDDLQKNLEYAAQVLETVYIDETR